MKFPTRLWTARTLVIIGFLFGWNSIGATIPHIGNDAFLLTPNAPLTPTHSWHHYFRELGGDFGAPWPPSCWSCSRPHGSERL